MQKTEQKINGWIIIDKPQGLSSNAVLSQLKKLFHVSKLGHTGTLDPFATGVLPVAFGEATKLISFLNENEKIYEFTLKFGQATTTDDIEGQVVATSEVVPNKQQILNILPQFCGQIEQTPSAYSAIKINGQRAYKLARQGLEVAMPKRKITIFNLELSEMLADNLVKFRVICSKGTYVRTLGKDIAAKLNTVGHLTALRRIKSGNFGLESAFLLENLKKIEHIDETLQQVLTPLCDITELAVSDADAKKLKCGQSLSPKSYNVTDGVYAAVNGGNLVAMVEADARRICPTKVFNI